MDNQKLWYVVNTYSGHESKVKEKLEMRINSMGMQDNIFRVIIPEQKEIEVKDGVSKEKVKKMFPGYVLIEMIMSDEAWYVVRNTPGVTGFIGSSGKGAKPFPVPQAEIDSVLRRLGNQDLNVAVDFQVGDNVQILNGPFKNSEGIVESMNEEKKEATVLLILFGRETPTDIAYQDLKKVE